MFPNAHNTPTSLLKQPIGFGVSLPIRIDLI
jgi:hypothetical protein